MHKHLVSLSDSDIQVLNQMIAFGQMEISRQMKRLSQYDFDIKEYYWYYRYNSNNLKDVFIKLLAYR